MSDTIAHKIVRFLRVGSDAYFKDNLVYRAMMLESVAAVPGYVLLAFLSMPLLNILPYSEGFRRRNTAFLSSCSIVACADLVTSSVPGFSTKVWYLVWFTT